VKGVDPGDLPAAVVEVEADQLPVCSVPSIRVA
jgi:hypothetical protein